MHGEGRGEGGGKRWSVCHAAWSPACRSGVVNSPPCPWPLVVVFRGSKQGRGTCPCKHFGSPQISFTLLAQARAVSERKNTLAGRRDPGASCPPWSLVRTRSSCMTQTGQSQNSCGQLHDLTHGCLCGEQPEGRKGGGAHTVLVPDVQHCHEARAVGRAAGRGWSWVLGALSLPVRSFPCSMSRNVWDSGWTWPE